MSNTTANTVRRLADPSLVVTTALPAAGATSNSSSLDLGNTPIGAFADLMEVVVSIPATPSLADTKNITLTLQDSADNSTFAAIAAEATLVVTGAGGAGAAAASRRVKFPPTTRRYVRLSAAVDSAGGSNIAVSTTFQIFANS